MANRSCLVCQPELLTFSDHSTHIRRVAEICSKIRARGQIVAEKLDGTSENIERTNEEGGEKRKQNDDSIDKLLRLFLQTGEWLG